MSPTEQPPLAAAQSEALDSDRPEARRPDPPPAAARALAEAEERRRARAQEAAARELGGRGGLDPARYGDWEIKGIACDF